MPAAISTSICTESENPVGALAVPAGFFLQARPRAFFPAVARHNPLRTEQANGPLSPPMKILRLVLLTLAVLLAALAAALFARLSLEGAFPPWLLSRFPALMQYERWLPQDLLTVALAATLLACLSFGLAAPAWEGRGVRRVRAAIGAAPMSNLAYTLLLLVVMTLAAVLWLWPAFDLAAGALGGWLQSALWLVGIALVLGIGAVLQRERTVQIWGDDSGRPESSWPLLIPILLAAAFVYLWHGSWLPAAIPPATIASGLQAQAQQAMAQSGIVAAGPAGEPWLATVAVALALAVARNPFGGLLWASCASALAVVAATWLLGCELFRRAPVPGVDDDGRRPALLAALATAILMPALHLARLPIFLTPVLWGTLGLWALLRALRTGHFPMLATAGVAAGLGVLLRPSGAVLAAVGALVWFSFALTRRQVLTTRTGGVGWRGFWLWLVALLVTASPALCAGGCAATTTAVHWLDGLGALQQGATTTIAAFNILIGQTVVAPVPAFFGPLLGALFLLAIGGLLFHIDQPLGWILLGWLALGVMAAAPFAQVTLVYGGMAVLLPACGLALAFALDRVQAALMRSLGAGVRTAATLLSVGILLLAALINVRDYPAQLGLHPDTPTATARTLAQLAPAGTPIAPFAENPATFWDAPVLQFARAGAPAATLLAPIPTTNPAAWPATLPAGTRLLLPPEPGRQTLRLAQERYPGGTMHIVRDVHANPALYVYTLAE